MNEIHSIDNFSGYSLLIKDNFMYQCRFKFYESTQSVCKYFGFEYGTITGKGSFEHFSPYISLECDNTTSDIKSCLFDQLVK